METTVGQILLNDRLPADMRDYSRAIDKKSLKSLFGELAEKHPDEYAAVNQDLHKLSSEMVTLHGGVASLNLEALHASLPVERLRAKIAANVQAIMSKPGPTAEKNNRVIEELGSHLDDLSDLNYEEGLKARNPLAVQVQSGSRGNKHQYRSLNAGDVMVLDHKDRAIPIPILSSYSEGLDPVQYWAGSYGARKGTISSKFSTPVSGFLGKQLALATHRLLVTEKDCGTVNGIVVAADDPDNEGTVLATDHGGIAAGSVLTPKELKKLSGNMLVRSPLTCQAEKGICQKCAGIRERGNFPPIGDNIGIAAAQAVSEPLAQSQLNVKHTGGIATSGATAKSGLELVDQLVQVPKTFQGGAAISTVDGRVENVENAPQGGSFVTVGSAQHWVPPGQDVYVKKGETVEAGDVISGGIPNPAEITRFKGIGEGRRYFVDLMTRTLRDNGFPTNRRNVELLSRGLINHVRVTDPDGPLDTVPNDLVEYDDLVRGYQPRYGYKVMEPKQALGLYLEEPVMHYSIGTRLTPKAVKTLGEYKVKSVKVHADPPSFEPEMTRAMETLGHSADWMVRLGGFHLKKGLVTAAQHGEISELHGTSFFPSLAKGTEFGHPPKGTVGY
jgi:hypothetical protein